MRLKYLFITGGLVLAVGVQAAWASECEEPKYDPPNQSSYTIDELQDAFQEAHLPYHEYVNCLFEEATDEIVPVIPDWVPSITAECKPEKEIAETMKQVNTVDIMQQALAAYNRYKDHLKSLAAIAENQRLKVEGEIEFGARIKRSSEFQHLIDKEINYALVSIDRALISFSELRVAYLIHLHFQCMQTYLEKVLTVLDDLRGIIMGLPPRLKDASIH